MEDLISANCQPHGSCCEQCGCISQQEKDKQLHYPRRRIQKQQKLQSKLENRSVVVNSNEEKTEREQERVTLIFAVG